LATEIKRLIQQSAKSTADQDREMSGLKDEMETMRRKLQESVAKVTELQQALDTANAELTGVQDDAGARILSLQEKLESEVRSKAKKLTELVRACGCGAGLYVAALTTALAQEELHQVEIANERREHADAKEQLAKQSLALTALKDQLILKDREVEEARKRVDKKDELMKQSINLLRSEQDAVRAKVGVFCTHFRPGCHSAELALVVACSCAR